MNSLSDSHDTISLFSSPKSSAQKLEETKRAQIKFQNILRSTQIESKSNKKKCICYLDRQYDCYKCTRYYPIQVRRSLDGESGRIYAKYSNNHKNLNVDVSSKKIEELNELPPIIDTESLDNSFNSQRKPNSFIIKPIRQPISSTILSLIKINDPNNAFIPPPNINLRKVLENS